MARQFNPASFGTKATLLLCTVDSNALGAVITPILAVLAVTFPGQNTNLMVMLPPLFIIPTSIIAGKLSYYVSRKTLLTIGQSLYIIGGVGAAFFLDFNYILVMRIILGIGCGIVYPIVPTLIAQFYSGHERASMMGRANAVGAVTAMLMSLVAGVLATIGWHLPFYVDLFFVVVLIMQLIFLPKVPPEKDMHKLENAKDKAELTPEQKRMGSKAWLCIILMFVTMTLGMVFLLKMAILVDQKGLGDAAIAGVLNSTQIACAFCFALTFPLVFKYLKRYTIVVPVVAMALSFLLIGLANSTAVVFIGAGIFGIYLGYSIPYLQTTVSGYVHPMRRTFAITLVSTAMFAGQAASTPFVGIMETIMGGADNVSGLFSVMAVIGFALAVVIVIYLLATAKTSGVAPYAEVAEFEGGQNLT
jgi:MFS family permease